MKISLKGSLLLTLLLVVGTKTARSTDDDDNNNTRGRFLRNQRGAVSTDTKTPSGVFAVVDPKIRRSSTASELEEQQAPEADDFDFDFDDDEEDGVVDFDMNLDGGGYGNSERFLQLSPKCKVSAPR